MDYGIATVVSVVVLAYVVGLVVKASHLDNKWIPIICAVSGIVFGLAAFYIGVPDFPATDPFTAAAVGCASGLAATGVNQTAKQLHK